MAQSQRRSREPRTIKSDVGDRELPHGDSRRPCHALRRLRIAYNSCLMGKFRNGELATVSAAAKPKTDACVPHYGLALSKAMSLSGGRKEPLRKCSGTIASM